MPRQQSPLSIEYILLGLLEQHSIHGYDLYKQITHFDAISLVWSIKQSQLYALLERLEAEGLLTSTLIQGESHPNRKQFQLTSVGRQTFYAWRSSPVQHEREIRQELLAKLYFALKVGPEIVLDLIEDQRAVCFEWLNQLHNDLMATTEGQVYERIVYQYRARQIQATLDWLESTRKDIGTQLHTLQSQKQAYSQSEKNNPV
jgi:PadR family transcriptional regulator, regulatory protein AphA